VGVAVPAQAPVSSSFPHPSPGLGPKVRVRPPLWQECVEECNMVLMSR